MGKRDANIQRDMFNESKGFVGLISQQGPGNIPIVADDLNDSEDISFRLLQRLAKVSLGDGFSGDAFLITFDSSVNGDNDFTVSGGSGTDDEALRGYLGGLPLRKYLTSSFMTEPDTEIHSKSTDLTPTVLTDRAANYTFNEFVGRTLYPNINSSSSFTVVSNTTTTITVSGNMLSVASIGDRYRIGLTTPTSARNDYVILDAYVDEIDTDEDPLLLHNISTGSGTQSIESAIRKKVEQKVFVRQNGSPTISSSYVDNDGNTHYQTIIAKFTRTSGISSLSGIITDLRAKDFPSTNRVFQNLRVEQTTQLSGITYISGTLNVFGGQNNPPTLYNGIYITGDDFAFTDENKNFVITSSQTQIIAQSIQFSGTAIQSSGVHSFTSLNSDNLALQIYDKTNSAFNAWFDGSARLHLNTLVDSRQIIIHASGVGDKSLIVYDFPSGTLERAYITEQGLFKQIVENSVVGAAHEISLPASIGNHGLYIHGSTQGSVFNNSFINLYNESNSFTDTPLLQLRTATAKGGGTGNLISVYAGNDDPSNSSNNPIFSLGVNGNLTLRDSVASTKFSIQETTTERLGLNVSGKIFCSPKSSEGTAFDLRNSDASAQIAFLSSSGVFVINDNTTGGPGLLVRSSVGANKVRVNVNGLLLPSAEITQNAASPTTLNMLSNNGVILNYDYNNDSAGTLAVNAGTVPVLLCDTKNDPQIFVMRNLTVGSSGLSDISTLTIANPANNGSKLLFDCTNSINRHSLFESNNGDFLFKEINSSTNQEFTFIKLGALNSTPNHLFLGTGSSSTAVLNQISAYSKSIAFLENSVVGSVTFTSTSGMTVTCSGVGSAQHIFLSVGTNSGGPSIAPAGRIYFENVTTNTFDIRSTSSPENAGVKVHYFVTRILV